MPKANNLFDYFPELEKASLEKIVDELGGKPSRKVLYDQVCNRLIYAHAVPITEGDLAIDFAVLREVLKLYPGGFYNRNLKSIEIPDTLLPRFPNLKQLVWTFIEIYGTCGVTNIFLKSEQAATQSLGALIKPELIKQTSRSEVKNDGQAIIAVLGQKYEVKAGNRILIPTESKHADVSFDSSGFKLLGKNKLTTEVAGGDFGIAVDLRG